MDPPAKPSPGSPATPGEPMPSAPAGPGELVDDLLSVGEVRRRAAAAGISACVSKDSFATIPAEIRRLARR